MSHLHNIKFEHVDFTDLARGTAAEAKWEPGQLEANGQGGEENLLKQTSMMIRALLLYKVIIL